MKITIYELLGLIKDGKAPKKIKYKGEILILTKNALTMDDIYVDKDGDGLFCVYDWNLNNEVEILDEEDEFIDIEEFKEHQIFNTRDILELQMFINKKNADYDCKINDLIKNQRLLINKINERNDKND